MSSALLIIDMQHALCVGSDAAFDIESILQRINAVSTRARAAGLPVILVQHEEDSGDLQFDSAGWQLAKGLVTAADDVRVRKTTPDSFHQTELQAQLQQRGIDELVICGLQSDFCIDTTVRRALSLGYNLVLLADAHSTVDNPVLSAAQIIAHHNLTLSHLTSFAPRMTVVRAEELKLSG